MEREGNTVEEVTGFTNRTINSEEESTRKDLLVQNKGEEVQSWELVCLFIGAVLIFGKEISKKLKNFSDQTRKGRLSQPTHFVGG